MKKIRPGERSPAGALPGFVRLRHYLTYSSAQFWFWGQDLEHHKLKTFLAYGFERFPPPPGRGGKSMYLLKLSEKRFLCLWAYGLLIAECGKRAVFVRRGSFRLQITQNVIPVVPSGHITYESLLLSPVKNDPEAIRLWWDYQSELLSAVRQYESWVQSKMGASYRQQCLKRWQNKEFELDTVAPTLAELERLGKAPRATI